MNQQQDQAGSSAAPFSKDRSVKDELTASKSKIADLAQTATSAGKAQLDTGLVQAAGKVDQLAHAMDDAASRLKEDNQEGLASFATHVASSISSLADRLRERSVDDLASEARELARNNPAMFLAGSVAIGFGLTRFLKASSRVSGSVGGSDGYTRSDRFGSTYGDSRASGDSRWDEGSALAPTSGSASGARTGTTTGGTPYGGGIGGSGSTSSTYPEMSKSSVKSDGSVGGSRTDQVSGGSHG